MRIPLFAILIAAGVIAAALWAKSRLAGWEHSLRVCKTQIAAIIRNEQAANAKSMFSSPEVERQRIHDDQVHIAQFENLMVGILQRKPFGLPLTAAERKDLESAQEDLQKLVDTSPSASQ